MNGYEVNVHGANVCAGYGHEAHEYGANARAVDTIGREMLVGATTKQRATKACC